jgi:hypothetical protein
MAELTLADWTAADDRAASREGWSLFECAGHPHGSPQVQYIQEPEDGDAALDGDEDAWAVIRADPGSPVHARALAIIANENPAEYERVMGQETGQ